MQGISLTRKVHRTFSTREYLQSPIESPFPSLVRCVEQLGQDAFRKGLDSVLTLFLLKTAIFCVLFSL